MDNLPLGPTMLVVGMGGALLTLFIVAALIRGRSSLFPPATDTGNRE